MGDTTQVVAWNMRGYSKDKMEWLAATTSNPAAPTLAYLLQEMHMTEGTPLLGTPAGYRVLHYPAADPASHAGVLLLLHPAARVLWHLRGNTVVVALIDWGGTQMYIASCYVPPLTAPHRHRLAAAGLDHPETDALRELDGILDTLEGGDRSTVLMGDLNARTGSL